MEDIIKSPPKEENLQLQIDATLAVLGGEDADGEKVPMYSPKSLGLPPLKEHKTAISPIEISDLDGENERPAGAICYKRKAVVDIAKRGVPKDTWTGQAKRKAITHGAKLLVHKEGCFVLEKECKSFVKAPFLVKDLKTSPSLLQPNSPNSSPTASGTHSSFPG